MTDTRKDRADMPKNSTCSVEGCERIATARGLCSAHYTEWWRTQPKPNCSEEGCDRPRETRGMCSIHYQRWYAAHKHDPNVKWMRSGGQCDVDGCTRKVAANGFCSMHDKRLRKTGEVGTPLSTRRDPDGPLPACKVEGCGREIQSLGYCSMHYQRVTKYGDPGGPDPLRRALGDGTYTNGYKMYTIAGVCVLEHRQVMETTLGRPLLAEETVHHRNGVRDDNRPENLELWSSWHPLGQRVEDKVAWAIELLKQYKPDALRGDDLSQ